MTEILLHIGAHRTGTTSLQQLCSQNRKLLSENGIAFWGPKIMRLGARKRWISMHHSTNLNKLELMEKQKIKADVKRQFKAVQNNNHNRLIVSDENFLGTMKKNFDTVTLYPNCKDNLIAYRNLLPRAPSTIIFSIRSYETYWQSTFSFLVTKGWIFDFDKIKPMILSNARGWVEVIKDIRQVFSDSLIKIWLYSSNEKSILALLYNILGAEKDLLLGHKKPKSNYSFNEVALQKFFELGEKPTTEFIGLRQKLIKTTGVIGKKLELFSASENETLKVKYFNDLDEISAMSISDDLLEVSNYEKVDYIK